MLNRSCLAVLLCGAALSGCGPERAGATAGQALASVDGVEITALQLNEELARANIGAAASAAASKQLLQALIDRQLLQGEAAREKVDRDPKVMQAIDRARALIVAQAYLQKHVGSIAEPTAAEVEAYYRQHPEFFHGRKQFSMEQLQLPAAALSPQLQALADSARSIDEVAACLDARKIAYGRSHVVRSTADLAAPLAARLLAMRSGQVFTVQEGGRGMVIGLAGVQEAPVTLALARGQIAQFLLRQKLKESAAAELARLRANAKIDYLNKALGAAPAPAASKTQAGPAPLSDKEADARLAIDRGVAGLK